MPALPLAGPTYQLRDTRAAVDRCVNWVPVQIESGTGKGGAAAYLKQVPGKAQLCDLGAPVRGIYCADGVLYAVAGSTLYRVSSAGVASALGSLQSVAGMVEMEANRTQLCIVDGAHGYVLDLQAQTLATIGSNWRGSARVDVLDGYGIFSEPGHGQWYLSGIEDFAELGALDFATAEGTPGPIVAHIVKHRELLILQERTGEVWYDAGGADFPFARNTGAVLEVGCAAAHSLRAIDGAAIWLSRDQMGGVGVSALQAYQPQRISSHALEEQLSTLTEAQIAGATAYAYRMEGLSYYLLSVPGLSTTWVYEIRGGIWHERGEWVDGDWRQDIGTCHAYAHGSHYVGGSDGRIYRLDPLLSVSGSLPLVRDRITPHNARADGARRRFASLHVDCRTGDGLPDGSAGSLMLRYSDDGGVSWGNWRHLGLGRAGEYRHRARATMLGTSRARVWHLRCTDAVRCEPITAIIDEA